MTAVVWSVSKIYALVKVHMYEMLVLQFTSDFRTC